MKTGTFFSSILFAGLTLDVVAQPLKVGEASVGMLRDDVNLTKANCKFKNIGYEYTICEKETTFYDVPVTVFYYFGDIFLTMMNIEFDKEYFGQLSRLISKEYGLPTEQWVENSLSVVKWDLAEEHIALMIKKDENHAAARILSTLEASSLDLDKFIHN